MVMNRRRSIPSLPQTWFRSIGSFGCALRKT
jgi:hypothetical protein